MAKSGTENDAIKELTTVEVERLWCADCSMTLQLVGIGGQCEHCQKYLCTICMPRHPQDVCLEDLETKYECDDCGDLFKIEDMQKCSCCDGEFCVDCALDHKNMDPLCA